MLPDPPTMLNGSMAPQQMRVSHDAETPTLEPNLDRIAAIPDLPAGNGSSQPYPIRNFMLPLQLLQQRDAMRFLRHRNRVEAVQANLCLLSEESSRVA